MYNRYIPQPDGSYRRNRVPDMSRQPQQSQAAQRSRQENDHCPKEENHPCPPARQENRRGCRQERRPPEKPPACLQNGNVGSFLKNLLPRDFDTGDFFILLLLLLMAGDCEDDKNSTLLTLVLYLFM